MSEIVRSESIKTGLHGGRFEYRYDNVRVYKHEHTYFVYVKSTRMMLTFSSLDVCVGYMASIAPLKEWSQHGIQ